MADEILDSFIDELDVAEDMVGRDELLDSLGSRRALQAAYLAWRESRDVRSMTSRPTFYRWRSELLAAGGPDLSIPYSAACEFAPKQIRVREVMRAQVCGVPYLAEEFGLLWVPEPCEVAS